jgi:hypothetical protein
MANPYEMTALEDPAEIGSDLPPGGGRIQMPGGDVRSFQFEIPAGSDSPEVRRQAALDDMQFNVQRRQAEQAAEDEQYMKDLMANAQVQQAQKAIDAAMKYQSMRRFDRDIEAAKASGMSSEQAMIQAAMRNPLAFGGGSGAVSVINAIRPPPAVQFGTADSGRGYAMGGRYGNTVSWEPNPPREFDESGLTAGQGRQVSVKQQQANRLSQRINSLFPNDPSRPELEAQLQVLEGEINELSGGSPPRPTIAPPAGMAASPERTVFQDSAAARATGFKKGDKVRIKGVGLVQLR